jgi:hypothetical protein
LLRHGAAKEWDAALGGLSGPNLDASDWPVGAAFRSGEPEDALSDCDALSAVCADAPSGCQYSRNDAICARASAAPYLPTPAFITAFAVAFPWDTDFLPAVDGASAMNAPGATGWDCANPRTPWDRWSQNNSPLGDGDGYTELIDCDNHDSAVVPSLPDYDGFSSPYCQADSGTCYVCPEGSEPPPADDDGDDDRPVDGVDDDSADESGPPFLIREGCRDNGCGFAWTCDEGAANSFLAVLLGIPLRRRRTKGTATRTTAAR